MNYVGLRLTNFILDFGQSSVASPSSVHQQQLAMTSQQQALPMATVVKSSGSHSAPAYVQPGSHSIQHFAARNGQSIGRQVPGYLVPVHPQHYPQVVLMTKLTTSVFHLMFHVLSCHCFSCTRLETAIIHGR